MKLTKDLQRTAVDSGQRDAVQHDISAIAQPALRFGAASGGIGFLVGGTVGILKSANPIAGGIATSLQYATLGLVFSATRDAVLLAQTATEPAPGSLTSASAIAGGLSGAGTGLLFRGPRSILPGMICFGVIGAGGQILVNAFNQEGRSSAPRTPVLDQIARSGWSPMSSLSDEEYKKMLKEKLLKLEVEIAIVDDKIAELRIQAAGEQEAKSATND